MEAFSSGVRMPCFGIEDITSLITPFLAENCPAMCGQPKAFYFLDCTFGTDSFTTGRRKCIPTIKSSGHNYSDILLFCARSKYAVRVLVKELTSNHEALIQEKTHILDVLSQVVNTIKIELEDSLPLIVSSLRKRLSLLEVKPIYMKPKFEQEGVYPRFNTEKRKGNKRLQEIGFDCEKMDRWLRFTNMKTHTYDEILKKILSILRTQEQNGAIVVFADAGTGKTRFAEEVSKYLKDNRIVVVHIKAKEHERFFSYERDVREIVKKLNNDKDVVYEKAALIIDAIDEICPYKRETVLAFLEQVVGKFLFVLATARPQEEEQIKKALRNFEVTPLAFKTLYDSDVEEFMTMQLRGVKNGQEEWNSIKSNLDFMDWTPQLMKLVAEYIQIPSPLKPAGISNNFYLFWNIFNERLRKSRKTLPNVDLLDAKIAYLKATVQYVFGRSEPVLTDLDKIIIECVGLAYFVGDTLVFTHYLWAEFLLCLALMAPKGMFKNIVFGIREKAAVLESGKNKALDFLNGVIGTDFVDEDFGIGHFAKDADLANYLAESQGHTFFLIVLAHNYRQIYFEYLVPNMANFSQKSELEMDRLLFEACMLSCYYNRDGKEEQGELAFDLCERGAELQRMLSRIEAAECEKLLRSVAKNNNLAILERLLDFICDEDLLNGALWDAVSQGHLECVQLLLKHGASPYYEGIHWHDREDWWLMGQSKNIGRSIHIAAYNGKKHILEFLLKLPDITVNSRSYEMKTPLQFAVEGYDQYEMVEWLLTEHKADVHAVDEKGWNVLHYAVRSRNADILSLLLEHGADAKAKTLEGESVFCMAATNADVDIVDVLLRNGADVNESDDHGKTVLHTSVFASSQNSKLLKRVLKEKNVNLEARDKDGSTALHYATTSMRFCDEFIHLLLEAKADVNSVDNNKNTVLHKAVTMWSVNAVERLLKEKCLDVNAKNNNGETALHTALSNRGIYGKNTAWMRASIPYDEERVLQVVPLLFSREDLDLHSKTNEGKTPLDLAKDSKSKAVLELVEKKLKQCRE